MESKALDKSIAVEPVITFLESRATRQSSTILTSAVQVSIWKQKDKKFNI